MRSCWVAQGTQLSPLWWPGGMGWGRWEGGSRWREHMYTYWLIHVVQQKLTQYCKRIISQLKKKEMYPHPVFRTSRSPKSRHQHVLSCSIQERILPCLPPNFQCKSILSIAWLVGTSLQSLPPSSQGLPLCVCLCLLSLPSLSLRTPDIGFASLFESGWSHL